MFVELFIGTNQTDTQGSPFLESQKNINKHAICACLQMLLLCCLSFLRSRPPLPPPNPPPRLQRRSFVSIYFAFLGGPGERRVLHAFLSFLLFLTKLQAGCTHRCCPRCVNMSVKDRFHQLGAVMDQVCSATTTCLTFPQQTFHLHRGPTFCILFSALQFVDHILCANHCRQQFLGLFEVRICRRRYPLTARPALKNSP